MKKSLVYIVSVGLVYLAMIVVMDTFPRSAYSELEQRELATFPEFSREALFSGNFTEAVSSWFSDTEPFRDRFMKVSMDVKAARRMSFNEEQIIFHAPEEDVEEEIANEDTSYVNENAKLAELVSRNYDAIAGKVLADEIAQDKDFAIAKQWNVNGEKVVIAIEKI